MKKRELFPFEKKYEPPVGSRDEHNDYNAEHEYDHIYREGETPKQLDFQTFIIFYLVPVSLWAVYLLFFA